MRGARLWLSAGSAAALAAAAAQASETITYSYDALGRLTATSSSGTVNDGVATSIDYDSAGNRRTYSVTAGGGETGGTVIEPPAPAVFAVGDLAAAEGGTFVFTVTRTGGTGGASSVGYATADGSASAGSDYQAASGSLSFAAGETSKSVAVDTLSDSLDEADETLFLNLSGASAGASIGDPQGVGTIADNDGPPPPPAGNNPPTGAADSGSQGRCTTRTYDVLQNDSDPDGDSIALVSVAGAGFTVGDSVIRFSSTSSTGAKVGTYTIQDSRGATASARLTVSVTMSGSGTCSFDAPPPGPAQGPGGPGEGR